MAAAPKMINTQYATDRRSKCQLCSTKIAKDCWRFRMTVVDPMSSSGRVVTQSAHTACYFRNVTDGLATRPTTQSMPYYTRGPDPAWNAAPIIEIPAGDEKDSIVAAMAASSLTDDGSLTDVLPTAKLREVFAEAVTDSIPGSDALDEQERSVLELFCFYKRVTKTCEKLLDISEGAEGALPQPEESGDPLKGKFTQYSPNSRAHCRDCQKLLEEGDVRVGANVFSSSARHASFSVNYWCLECMCARPSVRRAARLNPTELEKVLPGASLLAEVDVKRLCLLLRIPQPTAAACAALADGRARTTRSKRKFGSWG